MPPLTPEAFAARFDVSRETLSRFRLFLDLLIQWQAAVNLVGPATLEDPWRRHVLDSAQLFEDLPEREDRATILLDLGSGAGFPGLVLALLAAGRGRRLETHLVESRERKAAFLTEAARRLDLAVTVHARRIESMKPFPVDVITARALAPLARLLELCDSFLTLEGSSPVGVFLKGEGYREELTEAQKAWTMNIECRPSISDARGTVIRTGKMRRGR